MSFLCSCFGGGRKSKPAASKSSSSKPQPAHSNAPTHMISPDPFPDDATFEAVRQHVLARAAENRHNPVYQAMMREAALQSPLMWLQSNFPDEQGYVYCTLGPFPRDIKYVHRNNNDKPGTIPQEDTSLYLIGRGGDHTARVDGKKQGGVVCVAMCALPPAGVGEPETAGTPFARGTLGTPAMDAAEKALLGFIKEMQDVGHQGSMPLGERVEGCLGIVFMGVNMLIYEYSKEKGFFDPPGGFEVEDKKVEAEPLPWPPLPDSGSKQQ
ncbi:hypothetical protein NEMBOFW57_010686 [Staphylotrichum longicolle]|uniref:Uncharacterized protein n=1 Tax=Staphylotrichum longicolle TaxID=669026 RepID=A0AAD4HT50_9PEZI|nr:hypothetical protein NEMBOFW57_010686 [Staphylotrichum longicolle]